MTNDALIDRIIWHEGFCAMPKPDAKGMYEIGFGHDLTKAACANYPDGITFEEAEKLLEYDLSIIKQNSAREFPWLLGLDDMRQSVIYEMCYQLGISGVAKFKNMIAAIRDQDWDKAAQEMLDSAWHQETPGRCEELARLMLNGKIIVTSLV